MRASTSTRPQPSPSTSILQLAAHLPRNAYLVPPCGHAPSRNLLLVANSVVFPHGTEPGVVHIKRRRFQFVAKQSSLGAAGLGELVRSVESTGGTVLHLPPTAVVSPGVVDVHVHLQEPGRVAWEGVASGTAAAAAGGVTTVADMPLQASPATTTAPLLAQKAALAKVRGERPGGKGCGVGKLCARSPVVWSCVPSPSLCAGSRSGVLHPRTPAAAAQRLLW